MGIDFIDAAWYRLGYRFDHCDEKYVSVNLFGNSNQHIMDNFSQRMLMMPTMARQNETDALAQGIDLTHVQPWQHGNRNDIDDALFRIAPEQLTTHVQWQSIFYDVPISLQLTSELNGRQNHVSALQSEKSTAGYGLIHLSALWQLTPKLQITAKVNNAFDKEYAAHTAGINRVMNTTLPVEERVPNAGREWQLSISYHL